MSGVTQHCSYLCVHVGRDLKGNVHGDAGGGGGAYTCWWHVDKLST